MKELPFVSIITVNYNGKKWLKDCFESLDNLAYSKNKYEVIMGDNASSDDSVEYAKKNFPWIRILKFDKNYGFCKGNNLCAKEAKGEYLVFLNTDTIVTKSWLKNLVDGVLSEKDVMSCACKMLYPLSKFNGKYIINTAGGKITTDGAGFYTGTGEEDGEKYNKQTYTGFGCGAGVLIEKKFFIGTGGFDEYYVFSVEEMDLGLRVWMYGYKVLYVPHAIMYHFGSGTISKGGITPTQSYMHARNRLHFIFKNYGIKNVVKGVFCHSGRCFVMIIYALLHKNYYVPYEIVNGYFSFFKNFKETIKKRKELKKNKKRSDDELYNLKVIASVNEWFKDNIRLLKNENIFKKGVFATENKINLEKINK
ncbi:hypothetical protein MSIBF_A1070004 [groundwater metagenome]|uniref:Glycosyltransferase 2-like domain-containing protein n=1 Tax=groundwater metagenome TaxID=717931 RepID=A0A098E5T9_9ZZZZ